MQVPPAGEALLPATPLARPDRLLFLDCLRGIAVLGILFMNSMGMAQPGYFYSAMDTTKPITGPNLWVWIAEMGFFEGTMRGMFSILFGAGTILLLQRLEKTRGHIDAADVYYRRVLWLLVFGLVNGFIFLWQGDILYMYALCGMALFPFRNVSWKKLFWCGLFFLAVGTFRENHTLYNRKEIISKGREAEALQKRHKKLSKEQSEALDKWKGFQGKASPESVKKEVKEEIGLMHTGGIGKRLAHIRDAVMEMESVGVYNFWWDVFMFFFVGMALYKSGFLLGQSRTGVYVAVAVLGTGIALLINYFDLRDQYAIRFDFIKHVEHQPFDFYQVRRLMQTLGYLSILVLLYKASFFRKLLLVFAPVGQMAFTNYLVQSIVMSVIFVWMRWYGALQRYQVYEIVGGIWLFQIVFSHLWMRYFLFGPFEWSWRSLTYMKTQPFRKGAAVLMLIALFSLGAKAQTSPPKIKRVTVFSIGPFIGPAFSARGSDLKDHYVLAFTEGYEKRRTRKLSVYLDKVVLQ